MARTTPRDTPTESADGAPVRRLSRRRLWLFRITAATLIPAVFFGLLELALRVSGFGNSGAFLQPVPGRAALMGNPRFGWRFFPPAIARLPQPFVIANPKPAGTYRIFILGESAAMGDPEPAFGFGRLLEVMLRERFPEARFEVINAAMVAINSHVIREIVQDCAKCDPDLFIAYIGNNEVVGPFGAGTVFAGFSPNLSLIRAGLALEDCRLIQLARRAKSALVGDVGAAGEWKGMEFFLDRRVAADDPQMAAVYSHFRTNLREICDAGAGRGAALMLCTVPVNLSDCAPFTSLHRAGLSTTDVAVWDQEFAAGTKLQAAGDFAAAAKHFEAAAAIDDRHAEVHYRLAKCRLAAAEWAAAGEHFVRARDLDALRFRADSRINAITREVAGELGGRANFLDAELLFAQSGLAEHGIPGRQLFHEHCHLTFEGNYVLAGELFRRVMPLLPDAIRGGVAKGVEPPPIERCAERLAYTPYARQMILTSMLTKVTHPPFTQQADHEAQIRFLRDELAALRAAIDAPGLAKCRETGERAVQAAPEDPELRRIVANVLSASGDYPGAAEHLRKALALRPFEVEPRITLAGLCVQLMRYDDAAAELMEALRSPRCDRFQTSEAYFTLGVTRERQERLDDAQTAYREALRGSPNHMKALTNLGLLLRRRGEKAEGDRLLKRVVEVDPQQPLGHLNVAIAAAQDGRNQDAITSLREAVRLQPDSVAISVSLANALQAVGSLEEARSEYSRAIRLAPDSAEAHFGLGRVYQRLGMISDAAAEYAETLRLKPGHPGATQALRALRAPKGDTP